MAHALRLRRAAATAAGATRLLRPLRSTPTAYQVLSHLAITPAADAASSAPFRGFMSSSLSAKRWDDYGSRADESIDPDEILFEGCDYKHWLITMEFPQEPKPTAEEMVETYVQTAAKVLGSVEAAKKKIYACSTTTYQGFQLECDEETSEQFKGLPGVVFILPDSYLYPERKEYGGDKYDNGVITPRPPPIINASPRRQRPDRNQPNYNYQPNYNRQGNFQRGDSPDRNSQGNVPYRNFQGNGGNSTPANSSPNMYVQHDVHGGHANQAQGFGADNQRNSSYGQGMQPASPGYGGDGSQGVSSGHFRGQPSSMQGASSGFVQGRPGPGQGVPYGYVQGQPGIAQDQPGQGQGVSTGYGQANYNSEQNYSGPVQGNPGPWQGRQ